MRLVYTPYVYVDKSKFESIKIKKDKRSRRKLIRNRSSRDISKYDAWRIHDRELVKGGPKNGCTRKISFPPAMLIKAFGLPTPTRTGFSGTGEYDFEDNNLDCFNIYDCMKTDMYHGINREDEYYNT